MANPYPYTFYTARIGDSKKTFKTLKEAEGYILFERYTRKVLRKQSTNDAILITEYPYGYKIPRFKELARLEQKIYSKVIDASWFELCKDYSYNVSKRFWANDMARMELDIVTLKNSYNWGILDNFYR